MKYSFLVIALLMTSFCFGQKVKRKIVNPGPNAATIVQTIYEYDTLGRKTREMLTQNSDTLAYQYQTLFFYDNDNKLQLEVEEHSWDLQYTLYYYDKKNILNKTITYNSKHEIIDCKLYKLNQWTEYIGGKKHPYRVQTTVLDSHGSDIRFYGWEHNYGRKETWNYKFVNEYSKENKLLKSILVTSDNKPYETKSFDYNSFGLEIRETRITDGSKPFIAAEIRYEYY